MKNHIDMLIFHTAICAENVTNSLVQIAQDLNMPEEERLQTLYYTVLEGLQKNQ